MFKKLYKILPDFCISILFDFHPVRWSVFYESEDNWKAFSIGPFYINFVWRGCGCKM